MAGDAEAAWMRHALAIDENEIRTDAQPLESLQHGWRLAEAEEAGNVRKGGRPGDADLFKQYEVRKAEDHHHRLRRATAPAVGHVHSG